MALITISSGTGSKSNEIAELLSKDLNLELYNDERIEKEALKLKFSNEKLLLVPENL
jgi:hypothetical protein